MKYSILGDVRVASRSLINELNRSPSLLPPPTPPYETPAFVLVLFDFVSLCSVKDALAVTSDVNVVRDACLRHLGKGAKAEDGLTVAQFHEACSDLAKEKGFENFKELSENEGLAGAVYSR